jgi:hypothetical protein
MSSANGNMTKKRKREYNDESKKKYNNQTIELNERARNRAELRKYKLKSKNNKGSMPSLPVFTAASCTGVGCAVSGGNRRTRRNKHSKRRTSKSRRR